VRQTFCNRCFSGTAVSFNVSGDLATNSAAVEFPAASGGNWGTISHMAVMTASTGGDMIVHSALTTAKAINDGDVFRIPTGDLDITLA
jgi:pSer/pThr/pTyr-binding forkhead associated (FHA) protein